MGMVMHTGEKTEKEGTLLESTKQKEGEETVSELLEQINRKIDLILEMGKDKEEG